MLVLDASIALAWCFPDEGSAEADAVLDRIAGEGGLVPSIWTAEVANAMRAAERRGRVTPVDVIRLRAFFTALPIELAPLSLEDAFAAVIPLSRMHELSAYDACYLALAAASGLPLATLDRRLAAACQAAGIELVIQPPTTPAA